MNEVDDVMHCSDPTFTIEALMPPDARNIAESPFRNCYGLKGAALPRGTLLPPGKTTSNDRSVWRHKYQASSSPFINFLNGHPSLDIPVG